MRFFVILLMSAALLVSPAHAKRNAKNEIGCVPSPNPNVPPCDLDQSPATPSSIGKVDGKGSRAGGRTRGGSRGKVTMGCVPSPDPNVPPCNLDQAPVLPSEIEAARNAQNAEKAKPAPVAKKRTGARSVISTRKKAEQ